MNTEETTYQYGMTWAGALLEHARKRPAVALLALLAAGFLLEYAIVAAGYGFWRPDSWEYLPEPWGEFVHNQRWLVPPLYYLLHHVPSYAAWLLGMALFTYFGYAIVRRYLRQSPWDDPLLSWTIGCLFVLTPGLQDQFTWPSHSFAAIGCLAALAWLATRLPALPLLVIGTPILVGIHQAFAFLTVLLVLPGYAELQQLSHRQILSKLARGMGCWLGSFAIGWLLPQLMLIPILGKVPELPTWRHPHPAHSLGALYLNIMTNLRVMLRQLDQFYTSVGLIAGAVLLLTALSYALTAAPKSNRRQLYVALFAVVLYCSSYVMTAPVGTILPFRLTMMFGPALSMLVLALVASTRRPAVVLIAAYGLVAYPAVLTLQNMRWFSGVTNEMRSSVLEIRGDAAPNARDVLIDVSNYSPPTPRDDLHGNYLGGFPRVFEMVQSSYDFTPAFYVNGFRDVYLCGGEWRKRAACSEIAPHTNFEHCATDMTGICSGGTTADGYWLVQLYANKR